jgi:hypothetical protein
MISGIHRSKPVAAFLVALMVFFVCQTVYPQAAGTSEKKADKAMTEGLDLYRAGEYVKAIERFSRVVALSKDDGKLADAYFYLSLCNYFMGETDGAEEWAVKSLELEPGREASDIYPAGFIELFKKAKRTAGIELDKKRRAESRATTPPKTVEPAREPEETPRTPVVTRAREKEGGGHGGLYLLIGVLVAGGAAAAYFLLKGKDEGGGGATTGTIQVSSTPTGARVYLDGTDKGTAPLTISSVSVGSHALRLTLEGYREYLETVNVEGGKTATVAATLSKHTISVTSPAANALWQKKMSKNIIWTTDTSATVGAALALRRAGAAAFGSPTRWALGGGAAMARPAAVARASGQTEKGARRGADLEGTQSTPGGTSQDYGPAGLRSPRLDSLARMGGATPGELGFLPRARALIITDVKIELYKGGEQIETIVASTANDGSYSWTVRKGLADSKNYKIRVSCATDSSVYGESAAFEISEGYGEIVVQSTPGGAKIFLDGANTGKTTKATLKNVAAGTHTVKVEKTGYDPEEQTVTVTANRTVNVSFTLEGYGKIKVTSTPGSAKVYLDGSDTGKTTTCTLDRVVAGTHIVKAEKTGYITQEKTVNVVAGKTATVNFELKQIGKIKVNSTPTGATVYLDGSDTGEVTNCTLEDISPGTYAIKVELDGYETQEKNVTVPDSGGTVTVSFTLVKTSITIDKPDWWSIWGKGKEVDIKWATGSSAAGWNGLRTERELRGMVPSLRNPLRGGEAGRTSASLGRAGDRTGLGSAGTRPGPMVGAVVKSADGASRPQPPAIANVKIELYKGSVAVKTIADSTANDGLFTWTVDEELEDGIDYKVVISDAGGSGATGESMTFALTDVTYEYQTSWGGFGAADGQFSNPYQVCVDGFPYVYVADYGNTRIQKFTASGGWIRKWGTPGTLDGQFNGPTGVAADKNSYIYVSEYFGHRIQRFSSLGLYQNKWGSYGSGAGQFNNPYYVAIDPYGYVYVADRGNHRVQKFWQNGAYVRQWGAYGTGDGQFNSTGGIAIDAWYTVYVVDRGNNRVQVFDNYGVYKNKFGSAGSGDGQLNAPMCVAVDACGFIYVTDFSNNRVQKFSPRGLYCCKWGTPGVGYGQFAGPTGIAVDKYGNVYVAEQGNDRVQKFK